MSVVVVGRKMHRIPQEVVVDAVAGDGRRKRAGPAAAERRLVRQGELGAWAGCKVRQGRNGMRRGPASEERSLGSVERRMRGRGP